MELWLLRAGWSPAKRGRSVRDLVGVLGCAGSADPPGQETVSASREASGTPCSISPSRLPSYTGSWG